MSQTLLPSATKTAHRLNIGCGRRFHRDWVNVDLEPQDDCVLAHDITRGLPFADQQFDAVYHSHVLEHLSRENGRWLIEECHRVLRSGGVLRIVVPDLEQIARLYLDAHSRAWQQGSDLDPDYEWMKLELLDQLVRHQSGGQMGRYMANGAIANEDFVRSRLGDEFSVCRKHAESSPAVTTMTARVSGSMIHFKRKLARRLVRWLMGSDAESALEEGLFRRQGEVHRWMYDRFSLRMICEAAGMTSFRVCDSTTSQIPNFTDFDLDAVGNRTRKPDSIFVECVKP